MKNKLDPKATNNTFDTQHLKYVSKINKNNISYLTKRGLDPKIILNDEKFSNKILVYNSGKTKNTVFPTSNENKPISGFILENNNLSAHIKSSEYQNSLWVSNHDKSKPLDKLIVAESPINALSHYQLNKTDLAGKNVLYVATGGSMTNNQIRLIDKINVKSKPKDVETIFNNDEAGHRYASKLNGTLKTDNSDNAFDSFKNTKIDNISFSKEKNGDINLLIDVKSKGSFDKDFKLDVYNEFNRKSHQLTSIHPDKVNKLGHAFELKFDGKPTDKETDFKDKLLTDKTKIKVSFPNNKFYWDKAHRGVASLNNNMVKNTFPLSKDFNSDLNMKVGKIQNNPLKL